MIYALTSMYEMPTSCKTCQCRTDETPVSETYGVTCECWTTGENRPDWCPLVDVAEGSRWILK